MARKPKRQGSVKKASKRSSRTSPHTKGAAARGFLAPFTEIIQDELHKVVLDEGSLSPDEARRMIAMLMRGLTDQTGSPSESGPHGWAMVLCDQARHASSEKAKKLALQALADWPDCAEAYVILAELANSVSEAVPLYEQGVAAGRRALAEQWDWLQENDAFWGHLPSRPFLRALAGLANTLWSAGRRDSAAGRFIELLSIDPGDHQGIRAVAIPRLIEMDRDDDAKRILKQYAESDGCFTAYDLALLEFRKHGDSAQARRSLKKALAANEHVPPYLVGDRVLPSRQPDSYSWQSPEEAHVYGELAQRAWKATPGAIMWLRANCSPMRDEPSGIPDDVLSKLPQRDETWLVAVVPVPVPEDVPDGAILMVTDLSSKAVIGADEYELSPRPTDIWTSMAQVIASPKTGSPRRPRQIEFLNAELVAALGQDCERIGITARVSDNTVLRERLDRGIKERAERVKRAEYDGDLSDLPIADQETWIMDCQQLDTWLRDEDGQLTRPWAILVLAPAGILASEVILETPDVGSWQDALRTAMTNPVLDQPHRPGQVGVRCEDHRLLLGPLLGGIPCHVHQELCHIFDAVFADLSNTLDNRGPLTPYVRQEGMTIERVGHFFESAATYFRRSPWTFTPTDAVWEVQPAGQDHPWCAVVVGQNGETYGVALVEHFDDCRRMMAGELLDDGIMGISAMCLNFEEAHTMTGHDLDAADQFGWPVAAPEAYPFVYRTGRSDRLETPTAHEFDLLEAAIQTLPDFILGRQEVGTATALVNGRPTDVRLARVSPSRLVRSRRR